jgi:hypothetical protein
MSNHSHQIVQKLWNYCNVLPACRAMLGAGGRDDLLARDAQAGRMSYSLPNAFEPVSTYGAST